MDLAHNQCHWKKRRRMRREEGILQILQQRSNNEKGVSRRKGAEAMNVFLGCRMVSSPKKRENKSKEQTVDTPELKIESGRGFLKLKKTMGNVWL
jgi:hypothetical protein